jgi:hypothetical protein
MTGPGTWHARYLDGDRGGVWGELRALGDAVRDPEHVDEAQLVCDEMARRARQNVETLVDRLTADGYVFHVNDDRRTAAVAYVPSTESAADQARWLADRFGPVPLALDSWVRLVGDVWLVGTHPGWDGFSSADPLVLEVEGSRYPGSSIRDTLEDDYEGWREWSEAAADDAGPFVLPVAPDRLHKANVSGGDPYGFVLPDAGVDGTFVGETSMPFVDYLNDVFRHGGFPGQDMPEPGRSIRDDLAAGLLPL